MNASGDRPRFPSLVRPREVARAVTPLELFFDLVYVFTVSQLAHNLFEHVDARGMTETVVLTLAVMYAWFMTVWTSNWLDGDRRPVQLLLLGLMFASLLMSTSVSEAFGDRAGLFVIGYLSIQIGAAVVISNESDLRFPIQQDWWTNLLAENVAAVGFSDLLARAETRRVDGVEAPICSLADLVALKRIAGRERDRVDLTDLEAAHGELPDSRDPDT